MNKTYDTTQIMLQVQRLREAATASKEADDRIDCLGRAARWEQLLQRSIETPLIADKQETALASAPAQAFGLVRVRS